MLTNYQNVLINLDGEEAVMGSTISAVMGSTLETGKCLASHSSFRGLHQCKGKAFRTTVPIPRACGYSEEASLEFPPPKICKPTRSILNVWFHTQKAGFSLTALNHPKHQPPTQAFLFSPIFPILLHSPNHYPGFLGEQMWLEPCSSHSWVHLRSWHLPTVS